MFVLTFYFEKRDREILPDSSFVLDYGFAFTTFLTQTPVHMHEAREISNMRVNKEKITSLFKKKRHEQLLTLK